VRRRQAWQQRRRIAVLALAPASNRWAARAPAPRSSRPFRGAVRTADLAATNDNAEVSLNWTLASGATGYHVKRSTSSSGPYTLMVTSEASSYVDGALTSGTTYYYVVSATNSAGKSAQSDRALGTPFTPAAPSPDVPNNLAAVGADTEVGPTWSAARVPPAIA
jgi:hypothetical protein